MLIDLIILTNCRLGFPIAKPLDYRGHCPSTSLRDRVAEVQGPPNTSFLGLLGVALSVAEGFRDLNPTYDYFCYK